MVSSTTNFTPDDPLASSTMLPASHQQPFESEGVIASSMASDPSLSSGGIPVIPQPVPASTYSTSATAPSSNTGSHAVRQTESSSPQTPSQTPSSQSSLQPQPQDSISDQAAVVGRALGNSILDATTASKNSISALVASAGPTPTQPSVANDFNHLNPPTSIMQSVSAAGSTVLGSIVGAAAGVAHVVQDMTSSGNETATDKTIPMEKAPETPHSVVHPSGIVGAVGISDPCTKESVDALCEHTNADSLSKEVTPTTANITRCDKPAISSSIPTDEREEPQTLEPPSIPAEVLDSGTRHLSKLSADEALSSVCIPAEERTPLQQAAVNSVLANAPLDVQKAVLPTAPYSVDQPPLSPPSSITINDPALDDLSTKSLPPTPNPTERDEKVDLTELPSSGKPPYDPVTMEKTEANEEENGNTQKGSKIHAHLNQAIGGIEAGLGKMVKNENLIHNGAMKKQSAHAELDVIKQQAMINAIKKEE